MRLHLTSRLLQKFIHIPLGLGNPYWIDDADFDIDQHLLHAALPKLGDWTTLQKFTSRTFSQPLDKSRPL